MFVVKEYTRYSINYYFCRTIEKAKEIFDRVFWKWVEGEASPQYYDCETWEELLQACWEAMEWEDVVAYEPIIFEEDKS